MLKMQFNTVLPYKFPTSFCRNKQVSNCKHVCHVITPTWNFYAVFYPYWTQIRVLNIGLVVAGC